jgi:hypothetical protein
VPYPMIPFPTFAEFRGRLEREYGCTYQELPSSVGAPFPVRYLEREVDGKTIRCTVDIEEGTRLTPHLLRFFCRRLKLPPGDFGLHLDKF